VSVAIIPIDARTPDAVPATLLVLGRRQLCETLTVDWFAREHGLTPAEAQVLKSLCAGLRPQEIADRHGVALSTVRTQVGSLRAKTGSTSIRVLVSQVSMMPPLVGVLGRAMGAAAERLAA
jgi:DNA-binding CsgD family transcriptional regulator